MNGLARCATDERATYRGAYRYSTVLDIGLNCADQVVLRDHAEGDVTDPHWAADPGNSVTRGRDAPRRFNRILEDRNSSLHLSLFLKELPQQNQWPRRHSGERDSYDYPKVALRAVDAVSGGGTKAGGELRVTGAKPRAYGDDVVLRHRREAAAGPLPSQWGVGLISLGSRPLIALNSWDIGAKEGGEIRSRPYGGGAALEQVCGEDGYEEDEMRGTMVCGVTDTGPGREALMTAVELSERLGLRLVLAHVAEGIGPIGDRNGGGAESVTMKGSRVRALRVVETLAAEFGVAESAERRSAVGDPVALLGQIAAEEAADVILVGARGRGRDTSARLDRTLARATRVGGQQ
jgi:nucleotide-binding universal stress UspA family protein